MKTTLDTIKKEISEHPGISRRELAEKSGFDIRTVSAATANLLKQGFITIHRDEKKCVGRRKRIYFPADEKELCFAGFYMENTYIMTSFKDATGNLLESSQEPFSLEWASLNHTAKRLQRIINKFEEKSGKKVNAAAISFRERRGSQFTEGVRQLLGVYTESPVYSGTPIDAFAWAAKMQHPDAKKIVMMHFGMFLIEIAVLDNLLQDTEAEKFAKKLSHSCVEKDGPPCYCGKNGCLEYYVHGFSMREELKELKNIDPREKIDLLNYYYSGDPDAVNIVEKAEKHIQWAIQKTEQRYKPDIFFILLLEYDDIIKAMKSVNNSLWASTETNFQLYVPKTNCSEAITDKVILLNRSNQNIAH